MNAPLLLLWTSLLMDLTLQSSIQFNPDRSQFFRARTLMVRCNGVKWKVWRSSKEGEICERWGMQSGPWCKLKYMELKDSGQYWCQSEEGAKTDSYNISVTDHGVILHMPVLPVSKGKPVNLICQNMTGSAFPARFYRDRHLLSEQLDGRLTLQASDEGLYSCEIGGERSQESRLRIKPVTSTSAPVATAPASTAPPPVTSPAPALPPYVFPVVGTVGGVVFVLVLVLIVLLVRRCKCRKSKGSRRKRRRGKAPPPPGEPTRQCKHHKRTTK